MANTLMANCLREASPEDFDSMKESASNTPVSAIASGAETAASSTVPSLVGTYGPLANAMPPSNTPVIAQPPMTMDRPAFHRTLSDALLRHVVSNRTEEPAQDHEGSIRSSSRIESSAASVEESPVGSFDYSPVSSDSISLRSDASRNVNVTSQGLMLTNIPKDTCMAHACHAIATMPKADDDDISTSLPRPHPATTETQFPNNYRMTSTYPKIFYIPTHIPAHQVPKKPKKGKSSSRRGPGELWSVATFFWLRGYFGDHPLVMQQNQLIRLSGHTDRSTMAKHEARLLNVLFCKEHHREYAEECNAFASTGRTNSLAPPPAWQVPNSLWAGATPDDWNLEQAEKTKVFLERVQEEWRADLRVEIRIGEPEEVECFGVVEPFSLYD